MGAVAISVVLAPAAGASPYTTGDVFVSAGNGLVNEFTPSGTLVQTLDTGNSATYTTGSAFDSSGNLYVTDFSSNAVSKFDNAGALLGTFGSGYNADPESIVFDAAGNAYVGQADGAYNILKFDASGNSLASYAPTLVERGTDWIDLASDQCTIYYDSEGPNVHRFNVCTNTQLTDFTTSALPGSNAYALRILPDGGALVADSGEVVRLDNTGAVVQTYTVPNDNVLFALNLDPDGTSFWTADLTSGDVAHINIATGAVLGTFNGLGSGSQVAGLSILGERTAAHQFDITLAPASGSAAAGGSHTVTATTTDTGSPLSGQLVTFTVTAGPNSGQTGTATTDSSGQAAFTYTDTGGAGTDTISASFSDPNSIKHTSNPVTQTWTAVTTPTADVAIKKTGPATAGVGYPFSYSLKVTNNGPDTASGVTVTDTLPAGETYTSATPTQGTCNQSAGTVSCALGSVNNGATATVTVTVTAMSSGTYTNQASVTANEQDSTTSNNTSSATTTVGAVAKIKTRLSTGDAQAYLHRTGYSKWYSVNFKAKLTTTSGHPISGKTVTFRVDYKVVCSGITNSYGVATCTAKLQSAEDGKLFTARFAGDSKYAASSATNDFAIHK